MTRENIDSVAVKPTFRLLALLLIGVGISNILDYFLTLYAVEQGFREGNPIMNAILDTSYFPSVKLIIVPLFLYFIWHVRSKIGYKIYYYAWFIFIVYISLMVYYLWLYWIGYLSYEIML
ncbi:MAG: hypothetical protein APF76_08090 [Desulfitibacter sp. BRH_c19]|nr:MAG: hypothetical protein APF76_08090 [Desulfitibacter sp. BRH_c19]